MTKATTEKKSSLSVERNHFWYDKIVIMCIILVLGSASSSNGDTMLGNWENSGNTDGWIPGPEDANLILVPDSAIGVTRGHGSLQVTPSVTGYWVLRWEGEPIDLTDAVLEFDLTMVASEWDPNIWTKVADKIAVNSNAAAGWVEWDNITTATDRDSGGRRIWIGAHGKVMRIRPTPLTFRTTILPAQPGCRSTFRYNKIRLLEQEISTLITRELQT